ncbi:MAG: STAS domain-containing protein [Nocardioides sp.]
MELSITTRDGVEGRTTLVLVGSVDLITRTELVETGRRILMEGRNLDLDMLEVDFIDSTGIGALVDLHNVAKAHGTQLRIPQMSTRVDRILQVTGLAQTWAVA